MKNMFENGLLGLDRIGLDLDGTKGCQWSWRWWFSLLELLSAEFWHLLGWSTGPRGDDREDKAMKTMWSKFQEQLGVFAVTLSEVSSWEKLQSSRSSSSPPTGSHVQSSLAGPFFCLVLVAPSLIWRKTGALCQCSSRFYGLQSPADIQSANYDCEQQGRKLKREGGTEIPIFLDFA